VIVIGNAEAFVNVIVCALAPAHTVAVPLTDALMAGRTVTVIVFEFTDPSFVVVATLL
jgi:hypothetical protein